METQTAVETETAKRDENILFLFDVDGTLTPSRDKAPPEVLRMLKELRKRVNIAFVGGSNIEKQIEQIGSNLLEIFNYGFPENGVQFYRDGKLIESESILKYLGEETYQKAVNKILLELSKIECPKKRGTFIELRDSMINVSPVGRSCTREERNEFFEFDKREKVREKLCAELKKDFDKHNICCVIGGQISVDIFPNGWDKTYCLRHIKEKTIVFFGDMTMPGGNDYEIFKHERVKGVTVNGPGEVIQKVNDELSRLNLTPID